MYLTRQEIFELLRRDYDGSEEARSAPHYNLRVNSIIDVSQINPQTQETSIRPQHLVTIVTESIHLPEEYIGFLYPKKRFERNGLLVFNTGIIHPSYNGPLSFQMINLATNPFLIKSNDEVLELLVYKNTKPFSKYPWNIKNYIEDRTQELRQLPPTFLDINEDKIKTLATEHSRRWFNWVFGVLASIATVFIVWQSLLTNTSLQHANQLIEKYQKVEGVDDRLEGIEKKVNQIEKIVRNKQP